MFLLLWGCATVPLHPPASGVESTDAIYLAMVDRFENADADQFPIHPDDPQGWHGGDIQGLIKHLDRLQHLGIETLWLTPLHQSRQVAFGEWGAFHGYWPRNLMRIEPRFGDWQDLSDLRSGLAERGMSLILDMVYNHVEFDSPLRESHPHWFHPAAPILDWEDSNQILNGQVHGLPDLAQEIPEVAEHLINSTLLWLRKSGAHSIRVDAVRHIDPGFIRTLKTEIRENIDHPVELIGEIYEGNAAKLADQWRATGVDRVFDFPLMFALMDTVCGDAKIGRLAGVLSLDRLYEDPQGLIPFLDNHDLPRVGSKCDPAQAENALLLLAGLRGSPAITWGTEGLSPGEGEPENRFVASDSLQNANTLPMVKDALRLRAGSQALHKGLTQLLGLTEHQLGFLRIHKDQAALVGFGTQAGPPLVLPLWMQDWVPSGVYGQFEIAGDGFQLTGPGTGIVIFQRNGAISKQFTQIQTEQASPQLRTVRVHGPKGYFLSGAGPELGNWATDGALAFENGVLTLQFPIHQVLHFKRYRIENGRSIWETGENESVLVPPGEGVLQVPVDNKAKP
jgi:glycosidase